MFSRALSISKEPESKDLSLNSIEFFDAMNSDDIDKVKECLRNPDLKVWQIKDENGYTALHLAVFKNNFELTSLIIGEAKKGLGLVTGKKLSNFINEKTNEGYTALHYATSNGNIKLVKLLMENGATLDIVTNLGKNVMHVAAESNQPSMLVYFLLYEGQDISFVDENGSTPLHWACYAGAFETVWYLLNLGANINAQDNVKFTPLHLAVSNNRVNIVKLLLQKGVDKNMTSNKNELPIDIARKKNYTEIVNLLDDKDYNPLCTLEHPTEYVKPNNIYKKFIFLMFLIPEILIIFLILPFLESVIYYIVNLALFIFCLLSYFFLLSKKPGFVINQQLLEECKENREQPLKQLVKSGSNLKLYCPTCYVIKNNNCQHCFICDKCIHNMNHHCFWLNKCIGKENKIIYIIFIFNALLYTFYSLFICSNLLFDTVNIPYKIDFLPEGFYLHIDRGVRVLCAGLVFIFSGIMTFPLFFLFMIEMAKMCGLLGNKKKNNIINKNIEINDENIGKLEMEQKEPLLNEDNKEINNININNNDEEEEKKEEDYKIKIPKENFPLVDDRPSDANEINSQD